jgi:glycosyltransferase involved in cell wall biosynthesis
MEPLKVALLQYRDARDVRSWSGTHFFSKGAIDRHVGRVVDLSPAPVNLLPFRVATRLVRMATGKNYSFDHDPALARYYGRYFSKLVAREKPDLIYSPAGSACIAYLETDVPIVYYSDATWRLVRDYYPNFSNVIGRTARAAEEMESRAIERSAVALFSSQWAADSAVRDYGADPGKVHNICIGANLMDPPRREEAMPRSLGPKLRLLFVGALWEVKGGPIVLDALVELLARGYDAELTVVGCTPPAGVSHPRLTVIPYLNKQVPEERERFERLWREADFFVLASRCEAAGIVFCEASAYGLPSIAPRTGGVPSIVLEGRNGYTVPLEGGGAEYARVIAELADAPERYAALCESSRGEYESRLNWDVWGERVRAIVADALPALRDRLEPAALMEAGR